MTFIAYQDLEAPMRLVLDIFGDGPAACLGVLEEWRSAGTCLPDRVAILIQPLRDGLQRLVNRLMYGERDEPYAVLARLSRRLEGSLSPEATLPAVVETIAQALKLPFVAVTLRQEGDFTISASYG